MDNLTHTLIGVVAGDVVGRRATSVPGGLSADARRTLFVAMGAIGGSLPDLDLVLTSGAFAPGKLGYMLHHRGHTHTIVGCLALALVLYAGVEGWARLRRLALARSDRLGFLGMALLAVLLHLLMDTLNNYGVHPYWPFHNGWLYGDSLFIIEPLFWISAAPMFFVVKSIVARVLIGLVLLLALVALAFVNPAQPAWWIGAAGLTALLLYAGMRVAPGKASIISAAGMLAVTGVFVSSSQGASRRVDALATQLFPTAESIDIVLTPMPSNPLCWDLLLVQADATRYMVRRAVLSNAPSLVAADRCPTLRLGAGGTAPMTPVQAADTRELHWVGEFSMRRHDLALLVASHCEAREMMQFARVPFVATQAGRSILGDLRFDREPGLGFTEIELGAGQPGNCRFNVPWIAPRAELLEGTRLLESRN